MACSGVDSSTHLFFLMRQFSIYINAHINLLIVLIFNNLNLASHREDNKFIQERRTVGTKDFIFHITTIFFPHHLNFYPHCPLSFEYWSITHTIITSITIGKWINPFSRSWEARWLELRASQFELKLLSYFLIVS